jgi:thiamine biosynthesis lipoprotein
MLPPHHTFSHEAMATTFSVFVAGTPAEYARQAAAAAFRELDRLESELSRYVESSDIARANRLAEGESLTLGEDALRCLLLASRLSAETDRAFDPAYASLEPGRPFSDQALYAIDPARHELTSLTPRLHLDLGAVGKGYALDCMADLLREWTLAEVCLQSGGSTALALAPPAGLPGWPVGLGEGTAYRSLMLRDRALSGSGLAVQGAHLMDVRRGQPAQRQLRTWAFAADAASSDALSTAFFVMSDEAVEAFCRQHPDYGAGLTTTDGTVRLLGAIDPPGGAVKP